MGQPARTAVDIRDFPGMMTNVDANDTPPGASAEQVNATSQKEASLTVRGGLRLVSFEED